MVRNMRRTGSNIKRRIMRINNKRTGKNKKWKIIKRKDRIKERREIRGWKTDYGGKE
jgi:hypothetical protein